MYLLPLVSINLQFNEHKNAPRRHRKEMLWPYCADTKVNLSSTYLFYLFMFLECAPGPYAPCLRSSHPILTIYHLCSWTGHIVKTLYLRFTANEKKIVCISFALNKKSK